MRHVWLSRYCFLIWIDGFNSLYQPKLNCSFLFLAYPYERVVRHQINIHNLCEKCGENFPNNILLEEHCENVHKKKMPEHMVHSLKCELCDYQGIFFILFPIVNFREHCMFLVHWHRPKILSDVRQRFSCLLDERIEKKNQCLFLKSTLSVFRCTWTGRFRSKNIFGI